jgi:hypothetical protein
VEFKPQHCKKKEVRVVVTFFGEKGLTIGWLEQEGAFNQKGRRGQEGREKGERKGTQSRGMLGAYKNQQALVNSQQGNRDLSCITTGN